MAVWAISDLHLAFGGPPRDDRFSALRREQAARVELEWRATVAGNDLVLLPGDISMARNHRDVQSDLAWLDRLPGLKVLAPGNHDGWWNEVGRVRKLMRRSQVAVDGDAIALGDAVVCGARSCSAETEESAAENQSQPALDRLAKSLSQACLLRSQIATERASRGDPQRGQITIYVLWHHPPFNRFGAAGGAVALLADAGVTACVYGHLHAEDQWSRAVQGLVNGVRYHCVAADAVGFRPLRIDRPAAAT